MNKQNDQFREALTVFRDHYLSWSDKDPNAAERYISCIQLLGAGTEEAWARHFEEPDSWLRKEGEAMLAELGSDATFTDAVIWMKNRNTPAA